MFLRRHLTLWTAVVTALSACTSLPPQTPATLSQAVKQSQNDWYQQGQALLRTKQQQKAITTPARNVILFIADGHGITSNTALRILDGQRQGNNGEEHVLSYEHFPHLALSKTYSTDAQTPDSAGTATAMLTGVKTRAGVLSVDDSLKRGDCSAIKQASLTTAIELAEEIGMATGIVSTARITHATPAAGYAHSADRNMEGDADLTPGQQQAGCRDIASQLVAFSHGNGIEVLMGGGRKNFLPHNVMDAEGQPGRREDNRHLINEWLTKYPDGHYAQTNDELLEVGPDGKLLALFSASHMAYEADRASDVGGEPSLAQMTAMAIERLQRQGKGFFLLVEAGRVDHGHHAGNAYRALEDGRAYAAAVAKAAAMTDEQDTLIIATADHSHTLTMAGYSERGNPILGLAASRSAQGHPYTTLSYANGPGAGSDREHLDHDSVGHRDFKQPALVPLASETHGGEDVAIYARGPGAWLFSGTVEQNYIFHVMHHAAQLQRHR
ncbi:alkaline phosphatase [Pseudomaricurvus alkylphenolicus]|uniref:alkaline phosphatase n=1 Tax=Pseudomaricurvus alkylphenolicus TaxID=1306991 RepID=UPI001420BF2C|nr:alkaline phosphatase [Pseudomaricurvus alkylphenolicus]NIB39679.1 alkaline phosphatase [Pseudomaricurvus alkylphenolicus]